MCLRLSECVCGCLAASFLVVLCRHNARVQPLHPDQGSSCDHRDAAVAPLPIHLGLYAEWLADAHQALVRQRPGQVLVLDVEVPQLATHTAPAPGF